MDKIAIYLEKLGYTIEEQGTISHYLVIFKDGIPIGFLMQDCTLSLVNKNDEAGLVDVINFVKEHSNLEIVAGHEYLLATYKANKLTTYYDTKLRKVCYATYIVHDGDDVKSQTYTNSYSAVMDFVVQSDMLQSGDLKRNHENMKDKIINKLINYLSDRKSVAKN